MTPQTYGRHVYWHYPLFEWCMAFAMLGISACIFLTPKTIEIGAFRFMVQAGLTAGPAGVLFFAAGMLRAAALISNGRWQKGPWRYGSKARAVGAAMGAMLWFQLGLALLLLTQVTDTLSIGIPVYAALTVGELISCYRVGFVYDRRSLEALAEAADARLSDSQ